MTEYIHMDEEFRHKVGPIPIAREVFDRVLKGGDSRVMAELASVTINDSQFGGFQFEIHFHQSSVTNKFEWYPKVAQRESIGPKDQATPIDELNEDIGLLANILQEALDIVHWEFSKLEAASIGGTGNLTDYEFTYQGGTLEDSFDGHDINDAIDMYA